MDLSWPEALGLMQKLPHLCTASFEEKRAAFEKFGAHPYALVVLDRHCRHHSLSQMASDATPLNAELREFLAIELNYGKLSERARELLNRLAAFRKPMPLEAAKWMMRKNAPSGAGFLQRLLGKLKEPLAKRKQEDNLDAPIAELISWGLLTPIYEDAHLEKLVVHNLVRDFRRERENDNVWRTRLRDAVAFYTNLTQMMPRDNKPPAAVWGEMEAFELLMEAEDFEEAASLLLGAHTLLDRWGFGRYLENQYSRLLNEVDRATVGKLVHNRGLLLQNRAEYDAALEAYKKSLEISQFHGDRATVADSLYNIGRIHYLHGEYREALKAYKKSLEIAEILGNRATVANCLNQIGMIHRAHGEYKAALEAYQKSLEIREALCDRAGVASSLNQIGLIRQAQGEYKAAVEAYQKSLEIAESLGDRATVANSLHNIGMIHQVRREDDEALEVYQKSLEIAESLGNRAGVANTLNQIGNIHFLRGTYKVALEAYEKSLGTSESLGDRATVATSLHNIGVIHQAAEEYAAAIEAYENSLEIREALGNRMGMAETRGQIGGLLTKTGQYPEAFEDLFFALVTFEELGSPAAATVDNMLKALRTRWGTGSFDEAWQAATGEAGPDELK